MKDGGDPHQHSHAKMQRQEQGVRLPPTGKSQGAIGFLSYIGTDLSREAIGLGPIASRERSAWHSVKYVVD